MMGADVEEPQETGSLKAREQQRKEDIVDTPIRDRAGDGLGVGQGIGHKVIGGNN